MSSAITPLFRLDGQRGVYLPPSEISIPEWLANGHGVATEWVRGLPAAVRVRGSALESIELPTGTLTDRTGSERITAPVLVGLGATLRDSAGWPDGEHEAVISGPGIDGNPLEHGIARCYRLALDAMPSWPFTCEPTYESLIRWVAEVGSLVRLGALASGVVWWGPGGERVGVRADHCRRTMAEWERARKERG